jgi:hypothetical protein
MAHVGLPLRRIFICRELTIDPALNTWTTRPNAIALAEDES